MKRIITAILLIALIGNASIAQTPKKVKKQVRTETRTGNKSYNKKHYTDAETAYRKAIATDSTYYKSQYNLGNALYREGNYDRAAERFDKALQNPTMNKKERSHTYHNLGNSQLQSGLKKRDGQGGGMDDFQKAVTSYKESLKLNPKSKDTKYNLSYAQKLLAQAQQQQQNQQKQGGNDNNQQQQQQQQNNQQGNQQQWQQQQQQQKNQDQQNKQQQQLKDLQKEQQKKEAERLLNAVKNNEINTLKEHQNALERKVDSRIEKDW